MAASKLRADCARCAALCCVALAFDRSPLFAFDKPAGQACRHLTRGGRCAIHAEREARGLGGCAQFDCLGAGQAVTQEVFGGRSWREDPALLKPMMSAFAQLLALHQLRALIEAARRLPLPAALLETLDAYDRRLAPDGGWRPDDLVHGKAEALAREVRAFLPTLRAFAPQRAGAAEADRAGDGRG